MVNLKTVAMVIGGIIAGMVVLSVASAFVISKRGGGCPVTRKSQLNMSENESSTSESFL